MMEYTRYTTLIEIENLTVQQLDYRVDGKGNSIGALLKHIAALEKLYQVITFDNRDDFNDKEKAEWQAALDFGEYLDHIMGNNLDYYLEILQNVRKKTLMEFSKRDDRWLFKKLPLSTIFGTVFTPDDPPSSNYFCWFHLFEDELNHRGQIRLIRKKIKELGI